mgnify:CR=1 FL=1
MTLLLLLNGTVVAPPSSASVYPSAITITTTLSGHTVTTSVSPTVTVIDMTTAISGTALPELTATVTPVDITSTVPSPSLSLTTNVNPTAIPITTAIGDIDLHYVFIGTAALRNPSIYLPNGSSDRYKPVPESSQRLFRHYQGELRGANIFLLSNYTITTRPTSSDTVLKVFRLGTRNIVTQREADALVSAGYTVDVDEEQG